MTTTVTHIDPRVAGEIATQLQCAAEEIAELQQSIATARPSQASGVVANLQRELAYQSQLRMVENMLESDTNEQQDPRLVLLAQLRTLAEEARRVADNGRNESRAEVESRGLALRAVTHAVYYALYDDLREAGFRGNNLG